MQLRADALEGQLSRGLKPLYVIHGDEHLLVQECADRIRAAARAGGCEERLVLSVERGFDWSRLTSESQSMSLFGSRRLIELRIPGGKPGKEGGEALQALAQLAARHANECDTVHLVTLPRLDATTQKTAWFTRLSEAGICIKIDAVERAQLPKWIAERLAAQGQRLAAGDAGAQALRFIVERVEGNLLAAFQEIQKLGLLYPPGELTSAQILDAVTHVARYDVFKLNEAMLAGDIGRLARMLEGLRGEGEAAVLVLWAIVEEVRMLARVQRGLAAGKALAQLIRENRVWGPRERLVGPALKRIAPGALDAALTLAAQIDRQIKGLRPASAPGAGMPPADPWDALFDLALLVAR